MGTSPVAFRRDTDTTRMTFAEAIEAIVDGKRVTRQAWNDPYTCGLLSDGALCLWKSELSGGPPAGELHRWIVTEGDMTAVDWVVTHVGGERANVLPVEVAEDDEDE